MEDSEARKAEVEYIGGHFTEVIRELIRAVASNHDPSAAIGRGVEKMKHVLKLADKSEHKLKWHEVFSAGVLNFRYEERDEFDFQLLRIAEEGMKFFAEYTCYDPAAKGRAGSRKNGLMREIQELQDLRQRKR